MRFSIAIIALLGGGLLSLWAIAPASASQTCHPIAEGEIIRMWKEYVERSDERKSEGQFEVAILSSEMRIVNFTKPEHPGYPTLVVRTVKETSDGVFIDTQADTGAECEAFFALMEEYKKMAASMQ